MKKITKEEILNNKFAKTVNGEVIATHPTKEQCEKMNFRDICVVCFGTFALRFRPIAKAVDNANYWLENGSKEEAIMTMFPTALNALM